MLASSDSLITRLRAIAADATNSGYGTVTDAGLEFTVARQRVRGELEPFEAFVARVQAYRKPGDVLTWQLVDREYTLCRVTRR